MSAAAEARGGSGAMFDRIAERYDLLNRLMSFGLDGRWRRLLTEEVGIDPNGPILDVATGTADVAIDIARAYPDSRVVGLDPSTGMLGVGRRKLVELGLDSRVELVEGDAQQLPFADGTFSASCISFGIRNVPDRLQGLREMARVTRPLGKVVVLELSEPRGGWMAPLARAHVHHVVPVMGALISGRWEYRYLQRSIEAFPPPDAFCRSMEEAGLTAVHAEGMSFGAAHLYVGTVG